jgi:hypothetical protein
MQTQVLMTIENAIAKAPNAIWVLLNPLLEDTVDSYTFGLPLSLPPSVLPSFPSSFPLSFSPSMGE